METEEEYLDIDNQYSSKYKKGIGYWDIIKELYNGIVDTKDKKDTITLKELWGVTPIGQLQSIIEDSNKQKDNIMSVIDGTAFRINTPEVKENKKLITIQNPEGLNTGDTLINGEWGITYGGRDLSLDVDNYGWVVTNRKTGKRGYYIVERELIERDWVYVRWGLEKVSPKERREVIDKKRLRNKDMIKRDMVIAILNTKSERN